MNYYEIILEIMRWTMHVEWIHVVESICAWKLDCCGAHICFDVNMEYMTNKGNENVCRAWDQTDWLCLTWLPQNRMNGKLSTLLYELTKHFMLT